MKTCCPFLIPLVFLIAAAGLRLAEPVFIEDLQMKIFDGFQRLHPRIYGKTPVKIVDIDNESLNRLGQWPWPRTRVAELIERIKEAGAKVIAFDILFAEPDQTSPENILPLWPATPKIEALRKAKKELIRHDGELARALQNSNVVLGFAVTHENGSKQPVRKAPLEFVGKNPARFAPPFPGAVTNLPELETAAAGLGSISNIQDTDGVMRRIPMVIRVMDELYPSLAAEAVRLKTGAPSYLVHQRDIKGGRHPAMLEGITGLQIGSFFIPTDSKGRMFLYDTGPIASRFIPAWKVMEGNNLSLLKNKIVFVGTSAAGLKDLRITPLNPAAAGIEIHAQLAEQILLGNYLTRPEEMLFAELGYFVFFGIILIALIPLVSTLWSTLIALTGICGIFALSWLSFCFFHILVDPVFSTAVILVIHASGSISNFRQTEQEKARIRAIFSRYMSPNLVEQLIRHPESVKLGGETKNITIMFADIRSFTSIAEKFNAKELTSFVNRLLTPMTEIVLSHRGTIDKYIGDCLMAFWNAPLDDPEHIANACRTALHLRSFLISWNKTLIREALGQGRPYFPIRIGIGINTGECCVGNMGSSQRFDYSVLGDDVNLASRLEGVSNVYGVDILIGQNTSAQLRNFATLEVDLIRVKGRAKPVRIYALLGDETMTNHPDFQALAQHHYLMLNAYRKQNWKDALALLEECRERDTPKTKLRLLYMLYAIRIHHYLESPPEPNWDGISEALFK